MSKPIKQVLTIFIIALGLFLLYFILNKFTNKDDSRNSEYLKNYKVNEYISSYVSDEDMAKIYLNDYIQTMYYNIDEAYYLIDEEYRNLKFRSLDDYKDYVKSLNYSTYDMASYFKVQSKGYTIFGVYDTNGNFFAFKTNGVMQYSVYLDKDTVEIW